MPERLIVFVEEYSMEVVLEILLPQILGHIDFQVIRFQCKHDLLKQLESRLKGYRSWIPENWSILVLVDLDDDDCVELKERLERQAKKAGFCTKTQVEPGQPYIVTNRIVIEELEAWYFGDWNAVKSAFPKVSKTIPQNSKYKNPDAIKGGTWEAFERIMKKAGYFSSGLRKTECARKIAQHMNVNTNRSHSFKMFQRAVQNILPRKFEE